MKPAYLMILTSLGMVGCAQHLPLTSTEVVSIPLAPLAPSKEDFTQQQQQGKKILVLPTETTLPEHRTYAVSVQQQVEKLVVSSGNDIIDRDLQDKLRQELAAAEKLGKPSSSLPVMAELAFLPRIETLTLNTQRRPAIRNLDGIYSPERCTITAQAKIALRGYNLPDMKLLGQRDVMGSHQLQRTGRNSCRINDRELRQLNQQALVNALQGGGAEVMNTLAPTSYVLERRSALEKDDLALFKISMTPQQGAKPGLKVAIYRLSEQPHPLTQVIEKQKTLLAKGKIQEVTPQGAYVLIQGKKEIDSIQIGDMVRPEYDGKQAATSSVDSNHTGANIAMASTAILLLRIANKH